MIILSFLLGIITTVVGALPPGASI